MMADIDLNTIQKMIEKYRVYNGDIEINSLEYNYLKNTITGGVSWNF